MTRVKFIQHKGAKILLEDFSNTKPGPEFELTIAEAQKLIHSQPEKSVLALFDATNAQFNKDTLSLIKNFTVSNTPFIKAAAVIGISGLLQVALGAVSSVTRRNFKTFNSREEAMDWLASQ